MKLYFSRNYNPRLAVAAARFLAAPVEFEFASPFSPGQRERFLALNPNQSIPILVDGEKVLWEADAIACRLSRFMGSNFWRTDDEEPDMVRWLSWGYWNFVRACDLVHFERVTKQRYGLGPIVEETVREGLDGFKRSAPILNDALKDREWLVGSRVSFADFRIACVLPFAGPAGLPLDEFPHIRRWHDGLNAIEAWRDPFRGLEAPELPPVPAAKT